MIESHQSSQRQGGMSLLHWDDGANCEDIGPGKETCHFYIYHI